MIKKIHIQNFKSISNLEMDLGRINVLIGSNGSGKTNILEAIGLLSASVSGEVNEQTLIRRGVRLSRPAIYKTSLKGKKFPRLISLEATFCKNGESAKYRVGLSNPSEKPKSTWAYEHELLESNGNRIMSRSRRGGKVFQEKFKLSNPFQSLLSLIKVKADENEVYYELIDVLDSYGIYAPVTPVLRGISPDISPNEPLGLYGGRLSETVREMMLTDEKEQISFLKEKITSLVDWLAGFGGIISRSAPISPLIPTIRDQLVFWDKNMREKRNQISAYDASEGVLYVFFILVLALHKRCPRFFSIDNFDQSLNPRLARELTKNFCEIILGSPVPRQVILTTHNPLVLDGLDISNDEIRLFAIDRGKDGSTIATPILISENILKEKEPLSRLWVSGRIGGVPEI